MDFERSRIILPAAFVKGGKDQWVPLDPDLRQLLDALPRSGRRVFSLRGRNGREIGRKAATNRVINLAKAAGVRLTMHKLRAEFGCRYAGKVPAQVLQKLTRHANIATTLDFYVKRR